jgi:hypothetical protein
MAFVSISPARGAGLLLGLGLLAGRPAAAQSWFDEVDMAAGYGVAQLKWPSMQQFLDSYHDANKAEVLTRASFGRAPVQSLAVNFLNFAALRYERLATESTTTFQSGSRDFALKQNCVLISLEPAWRGKRFFIGPTFGMGAGSCVVYTSYRYPNGAESWGRERRISGSYDGISMPTFVGLRTGAMWKHALLTLRAECMAVGFNSAELTDQLPGDTSDSLPLDYKAYLAGRNGFTVYESVKSDLSNYRVSLQLGVRLNPAD